MSTASLPHAPTLPACGLRVGSVLAERYRIDGLLAESDLNRVYIATTRLGATVIVKVPSPAIEADPIERARFFREATAANLVAHPRAVGVVDDSVAPPFLVQPFIPGLDGLAWLRTRGGRASPADALWLGAQVLDVLVAAHARGVIHRDLKPENILVAAGAAYVIDWGLASIAGEKRLTLQGVPMGTPGFMTPEACEGRWDELDPSADTFAVGVILFEILTGRTPWRGPMPLAILAATVTCPAPPLRTVRPDVPADVAAVVDKALSRDRADRHATAADMLADVQRARASW